MIIDSQHTYGNFTLISVIIPTRNRNDSLGLCLDRLMYEVQRLDDVSYEVIVSDDSTQHEAESFIEKYYPWVIYTRGTQKGPAANRNNGAKKAQGEWLLFTDDDCLPDANWLRAYIAAIKSHPRIVAFEGKTLPNRERRSLSEECPVNTTGGFFWSCNCAIKRVFFYDILKGFDEDFPYAAMEDVDINWRIQQSGHFPLFVSNAIVIHPWRIQDRLFKMSLQRFISTRHLLSKHPQKRNQFGIRYYGHAFIRGLFMNTLPDAFKFGFRGLGCRIITDCFQLFFGFYMMLFPVKSK